MYDKYSVTDIDECKMMNASYCPSSANYGSCTNSQGTYSCECQHGYNLTDINGTKTCIGKYIF